jgi:hypothetical protein
MNDTRPIRATWPVSWDKSLEAACRFYRIRAHAASHSIVLLLTAQGAPFAKVPTDITLANLQLMIPLLLEAFELGQMAGEGRIKARMRELLRADTELKITAEPG